MTGLQDHTIQNVDCQCPINYLEESGANNCTNGASNYPRYNTTVIFNHVRVIMDEDPGTNWASSDHGNVTLIFSFNVTFQVSYINEKWLLLHLSVAV